MERTESIVPDRPATGNLLEALRLCSGGNRSRGETGGELPDRERRVLRELVVHAGQVVTFAKLREAAQDTKSGNEIQELISSIEQRLGISGCIEAVPKRGFRFVRESTNAESEPVTALRLAILPFRAGAGVPGYMAEALTEETGRGLKFSGGSGVKVLEQDSVATLARRGMNAAEIGAAIQADLVLEGVLQTLPGHYRLRAQMLRGSDGGPLWCEDLLPAQGRLHKLGGDLAHRVKMRMGDSATRTAADAGEAAYPRESYELLWRGRSEWKTLQRHQMQDALQRLQRAVDRAPQWIEARVELANLCAHQAMSGFMMPRVAASTIRRAAGEAMETGAEALLPTLGWASFYIERNLKLAQSAFERSAHLPHDRWITWNRTMFLLGRNRFAEAIEMLENCLRIDPYAANLHAHLAWVRHLAEDSDGSVKQIEHALEEFPDHELIKLYAAMILAHNGRPERAVKIAQELVHQCPYLDLAVGAHAYALASSGQAEEARAILEQLEWLGRERFVLRALMPAVHVALEDFDAAMEELRVSDQLRCPWFFQTLADPRLKPLRERAEFMELTAILPRMEKESA